MGLLEGVVVIEMAQVITGPMAGLLLADLGADVIKVESPTHGDSFRRWDGGTGTSISSSFAAYNRGKRSCAVDTQTEAGKSAYRRLVERADVVIENYRPGVMDRAGIGWASLCERNPRLVYCAISGMGSTGPRRDDPTYDAVAQALSGLWSQFTDLADPEPVGPPLADQLTGLYAALGVLAALHERERTGRGRLVETSMFASCLAFQTLGVAATLLDGEVPKRMTRARNSLSFAFVGADGLAFCVHLSSQQKFWEVLCRALEDQALATDERFVAKRERTSRYDELRAELQRRFLTRDRDAWLSILALHGVPAAPLQRLDEALDDPQFHALDLGVPVVPGATPGVRNAVAVDGAYQFATRPVPELGMDTEAVLGSVGFDGAELESLRAGGTIR